MTTTRAAVGASFSPEGTAPTTTTGSGVRSTGDARELRPFLGTARFLPRSLLGRGGMGVVYRVFDAEMGRDVALKTLPTLDASELVALKEEFRSLSGITHPNLIELYELFVDGQQAFFTMELLDGHDFVAHVRGHRRRDAGPAPAPRGPWLDRLADALSQLVRAVSFLHRAGKLHRDIKPSNVRVTSSGRLVLLDFGLATAITGEGQRQDDAGALVGTLEYMAPEQAWGAPLSPAADWYGVGVVLYQALTGELPFRGELSDIVFAKAHTRAPRPAALFDEVPPSLDELVMAMLHPDPRKRAAGKDVLGVLRGLGAPVVDEEASALAREAPLIGREDELSTLRSAFDRLDGGSPVLVRIEGPSGIGKTALVRRFAHELEGERRALVLRGRCHPQESVPYKAFDGVVDALSRWLMELSPERAAALAPRTTAELLRVFPVLSGVEAFAKATEDEQARDPQDPQELRRRAFQGLGELLAAVAGERPVALWIDDMQWGDADSVQLLRALLLGVAAPLLLLVGLRREGLEPGPTLRELDRAAAALPDRASHVLRLAPLGEAPARALATTVLGRRGADDELVASIAAESAGSPFFIGELARHAAGLPHGEAAAAVDGSRLSLVIQARIERLRAEERRLLEVVSTAGGPIDRSFALKVAGLGESGRPDALRLGQACLLRTTEVDGRPGVEIYHDRIREVLLAHLTPERRRRCHRDLAEALRESPAADPEALFRYYLGAGDAREAARFAVAAADRAAAALAFDRSAELYRRAIDLGADALPRWTLHERLAEALTNAGRDADAAASFQAAASALAEEAPADGARRLVLRRRAAEQFLRSGHNDEGMAMMRAVLGEVGAALPASPRRAMLSALAGRGRLLLRGLGFERRSAGETPAAKAARLDALWAASTSLSMMHHTYADALSVVHLRDALAWGDRSRIVRALGYEATCCASVGGRFFRARSGRLLGIVRALAEETQDPYDRAWAKMAEGTSAWLGARWADAARLCDDAAAIYREHCRGVAWELATTEVYALSALALMGRLRELAARLPVALSSAEVRDDLFALNSCRLGQHAILWLALDQPGRCHALAAQAKATWPKEGFHMQRYQHLIASAQADLYCGDPWGAWARVNEAWPSLEAAQFLRLECPRVELRHLRARAALAAAASLRGARAARAAPPDRRWSERRLVREALDQAERIERDALPTAAPFAALIRAGAASLRGEPAAADRLLAEAARGFDGAGMALYRDVARLQMGRRARAGEGAVASSEGESRLREAGVCDVVRLAEALAPGDFGMS
ncbi:serine/threonine-protein kinase [Sorangium sp. So ce542]|uniref:serine/threonine-protein kinase n=1 Tax=Sorangium sp. So ce542 TaxID=3133316 RepID=UPI003F6422D8